MGIVDGDTSGYQAQSRLRPTRKPVIVWAKWWNAFRPEDEMQAHAFLQNNGGGVGVDALCGIKRWTGSNPLADTPEATHAPTCPKCWQLAACHIMES